MPNIKIELDYMNPKTNSWDEQDFDNEEECEMFITNNNLIEYKKWPYIYCENCGEQVYLVNGWTNQCDCGVEYNGFGQRLAARSQWGWETGEDF